jgi:UDP-N-acetylglucosamine acyltransferase
VVIGAEPQDFTYDGTPTRVEIGDANVFREGVTVNKATTKEEGLTVVGSNNYFMACCHVAHDCRIGNHVLMANCVLLGGHTHIDDWAILSGNTGVHHFTTVGSYSFVGGLSRIVHDVPPYMLVDGNPSSVRCVNIVGLKRHGFSEQEIAAISEAHRLLYRAHLTPAQARETLRSHNHLNAHVEHLLEFVARQRQGLNGRQRQPNRVTHSEAA